MSYPHVVGEFDTMRLVAEGRSLARFGDGEFAMADGGGMKTQVRDTRLAQRLVEILADSGECLVGVPNIHPSIDSPKRTGWNKHLVRGEKLLTKGRRYYSSFISRPDSAPWINTPEYWALIESLWIGHDIVLVRGSDKSLSTPDLVGATSVREIEAKPRDAWADFPALMAAVGPPTGARVLLCVGATATVMAVDLCAQGHHAIDLGHLGMFLRKHRRGEPMWVTREDKDPPR
jgi:hypothetical protein